MSRVDETKMMHGDDWAGEDLSGWFVGEKFHGCRAYWDGAALWTRNGNVVSVPAEWARRLPEVALDCELWAGYGGFYSSVAACQRGRFSPEVRLMVFDANVPGRFEERQEVVRSAVSGLPFAVAVRYARLRSNAAAIAMLREVRSAGGEGLVARHPANLYRACRTREILKVKYDHVLGFEVDRKGLAA